MIASTQAYMETEEGNAWKLLANESIADCDRAIKRAEKAEAALSERDKPCIYVGRTSGWADTTCGKLTPLYSAGKFCLHCGHPVQVQP